MKYAPKKGESWLHWNTGDICEILAVQGVPTKEDGKYGSITMIATQAPAKPAFAHPLSVMIWHEPLFFQSFRPIVVIDQEGNSRD